jgi:hypothetical protein
VITIWYRIFGRKEINKIQELREELQEVRGKLTEAQIAAVIKDKNLLPKPKKAANKDKVPARKLIDEEKSSQSPEEPSEE